MLELMGKLLAKYVLGSAEALQHCLMDDSNFPGVGTTCSLPCDSPAKLSASLPSYLEMSQRHGYWPWIARSLTLSNY